MKMRVIQTRDGTEARKWQKHTTRALLSAGGALVKKHKLVISAATVADTRRHYIGD